MDVLNEVTGQCAPYVLAFIVWWLMNERLKEARKLKDDRIDDLSGKVQPVNEIMLTYGRLNQDLNAMLTNQINLNSAAVEQTIAIARQVATIQNPVQVQAWTSPEFNAAAVPEKDDDDDIVDAADQLN